MPRGSKGEKRPADVIDRAGRTCSRSRPPPKEQLQGLAFLFPRTSRSVSCTRGLSATSITLWMRPRDAMDYLERTEQAVKLYEVQRVAAMAIVAAWKWACGTGFGWRISRSRLWNGKRSRFLQHQKRGQR